MNREAVKQTMLLAMSEHHSGNAQEALRIVDAQLAALEASGVRLVPSEATFQMYEAAMPHCEQTNSAGDPPNPFRIWSLMLPASPYAPQKEQTHESD